MRLQPPWGPRGESIDVCPQLFALICLPSTNLPGDLEGEHEEDQARNAERPAVAGGARGDEDCERDRLRADGPRRPELQVSR